ncbi:ABC transporter permease [Pseudonocardia ailaonensis]|uniref:ABC transporter permease n=1 Tax=Pseudonocardia ailaonensis TaxID=367279 RepID=A0ABN2MJ88_9PSEU
MSAGLETRPAATVETSAKQEQERRRALDSGRVLLPVAGVALLVAAWELLPRSGLVDSTFLPPFSVVLQTWWELATDGTLWPNVEVSLARSLGGFAVAVAVGIPLGLLIASYRWLARLLDPVVELFRNTAALALLPVFILILGIGETSKVSIIIYSCLWPVLLNTISGVRDVDPLFIRSARSLAMGRVTQFRKVILPAAVPAIFTGIRLAGATSILVLIAAEMVGATAGLGYFVNNAQFNFQIPQMYAGILTISVIGLLFNVALVALERHFSRWKR